MDQPYLAQARHGSAVGRTDNVYIGHTHFSAIGCSVVSTDMEDGFVKWQGEAASTTVAADAASC